MGHKHEDAKEHRNSRYKEQISGRDWTPGKYLFLLDSVQSCWFLRHLYSSLLLECPPHTPPSPTSWTSPWPPPPTSAVSGSWCRSATRGGRGSAGTSQSPPAQSPPRWRWHSSLPLRAGAAALRRQGGGPQVPFGAPPAPGEPSDSWGLDSGAVLKDAHGSAPSKGIWTLRFVHLCCLSKNSTQYTGEISGLASQQRNEN